MRSFCPDGFDLRSFFPLCFQVLHGNISMKRRVCVLHAKFKAGDCLGVMSHLGTGGHTREYQDLLAEERCLCRRSAKSHSMRRNLKMEINCLGRNSK